MKFHFKVFIISFICFSLILGSGLYLFDQHYISVSKASEKKIAEKPVVILPKEEKPVDNRTKLQKLIDDSKRVNILFYGIDGGRADTIVVMSYDPKKKYVDLISVPRDTYNYVDGHDALDQKKINSVYGYKEKGGSKGLKNEVSKLLGIPIESYVKIKYSGVKDIIDVLGGIEVNVPFDMDYDDPYAEPELHIHLKKGKQLLDGQKSIEYLRWRKNNGEYGDGDLGRINRQQNFMKSVVKKSFGFKLPSVIKTAFNYVQTDAGLDEMIYYGSSAIGMDFGNLKTYRLPGEASENGSFYIHDPSKTEELLEQIYERK
ncbi:LCP family protein [Helicovermis profundi]|uniref:Cell envelope-related transcriptional attenuator domain-containing protein n=1 Tax=Helicovermis profundi TaxID=3065157 RepID=A0AAU9E2R0_9FIRM|nr:hypothetical protein HLPR_05160 [Clostridia bacterium S502]